MAEPIQCDNCGAVLLEKDVFCGECGAPRPSLTTDAEPAPVKAGGPEPAPPPAVESSPSPAPEPTEPTQARWRVAFVVLLVLGILACLFGVAAFLLFGTIGGDTTTPTEDWLIGAVCCLLPVGGFGAVLLAVGGGIWYTRLKDN